MRSQYVSRIEDFALDYLKGYYVQRSGAKEVHAYLSEDAKNGASADSLFIFNKGDDEPLFLAALQTEPSDKIAYILTSYKKGRYKFVLLIITLIFSAASATALYWLSSNLVLAFALSLILIPCFYLCFLFSFRLFRQKQLSLLVKELLRLPANERWLGISISSRVLKRNKLSNSFLDICKERGVGIITVGSRSKVVLVQKPFTYTRRNGDFLSFYKSEINIRKDILGDNLMRIAKS